MANTNTIKLLLAIAVTLGLHLRSIDFKTAFLHAVRGDDHKKVYLKPPKGAGCPDDKVWEILRALYGLPDSALLWHKTLVNFLLEKGFKQSGKEPCLLYKISESEFTLLTMIVDDVLLATVKTSHADEIVQQLSKKFWTKDLGKPEYVVGMHIDYDQDQQKLLLSQKLYLKTTYSQSVWTREFQTNQGAGRQGQSSQERHGRRKMQRGLPCAGGIIDIHPAHTTRCCNNRFKCVEVQ